MLEVLVTLVIISVGLLGLAGMQAVAVGNSGAARSNSVAAMLAGSLAASISTNKSYWGGTNAGVSSGFTPVASVTASGTTLTPAIVSSSTDCTTQSCAADEMADYDLRTWSSQLAQLLPGGKGEVKCVQNPHTSAAQDTRYLCVINISWHEKPLKSATDQHSSTPASTRQTYTLVVQQ